MSSTKIRGITIELGADTSGISNALKDVNGEIRNTQNQLKDVERLLKLDPTNTELLEQKQRLLNDRVGETKEKLDALKQAQERVKDSLEETGEEGQRQYDAITREIVKTEDELKKAEEEARNFNVTTEKIKANAGKIADKFETAAQKTRKLSMVAGGVLGAMGGLAYKTAQNADELNTMAKQTGFTTDELQKMSYASELVDVDIDTITKSAAKMTKQLGTNADKFEELGVSVRNSDGSFRDVNEIFYDVLEALSQIPNETERDVAAMDIFGRSANDLAGIIDDGGEKLRNLGQEAQDMGLIIPQEQIDSANEFNDAVDRIKTESEGAFARLGTEIIEMLLPYIPEITEAIEDVIDIIKELDPEKLGVITGILLFVAALSPLLEALSWVAKGVGGVITVIEFLAANPIVLLIAAIIGLVAVIATKGDEIQEILKKITDWLRDRWVKNWEDVFGGTLGNVLNGWWANIKNIWVSLKVLLDGVIDFIRGIFTKNWERAWLGVKEIFVGIFTTITSFMASIIYGLIALLNLAIDGINTLIGAINSLNFDLPSWLGGGNFSPNIPNIPKIPYFAEGGVLSRGSAIVGEAGAELLTVSNGRAVVQPLTNNHNMSVGDTVINVYGAPGQDVNELADLISEKIAFNTQRLTNAWA